MGVIESKQQALFEIAESQDGSFTAEQAASAGFGADDATYHVARGNWLRENRGLYRLALYAWSPNQEYWRWYLWSRNRLGEPQGVFSHTTALELLGISDSLSSQIHLTVPSDFRRKSVPPPLVTHIGFLTPADYDDHLGFRVTTRIRTLVDLSAFPVAQHIFAQAVEKITNDERITREKVNRMILPPKVKEEFFDRMAGFGHAIR